MAASSPACWPAKARRPSKSLTPKRNGTQSLAKTSRSLPARKSRSCPKASNSRSNHADLRNLLEFLTTRGKYFPLDLAKVATVVSTKGMFYSEDFPRRTAHLSRLEAEIGWRRAVLPRRSGGRPPAECCAASQPERHDSSAHAEVGHAPLPIAGQGDSLAERRGRVGMLRIVTRERSR